MMDMDLSPSLVGIHPRNVYGLRVDVIGNIHFNLNQEVIYPVEGVLAFHDFVTNKQRFMRFPEDTHPQIITISPHRRFLAIVEANTKTGRSIAIYDLSTLKKRRSLDIPIASKGSRVLQLSFTQDSKAMVILTKDENVYMLLLDKTNTVIEGRPALNNNTTGTIECIACNPQDSGLVAVSGRNTLMLMSKSEKGFNISTIKCNFHVTSMTFVAIDLLMVGTKDNELVLVESGEIKMRQRASDAAVFDTLLDQEQIDKEMDKASDEEQITDERVVCLTTFPRGFAFAIFNRVFVFEKVSKFKFERKTILTVPISIYSDNLHQITNVSIDTKQETVIVTTKHSQIYIGILIVPETLKVKYLKFAPLGALIHISEIIDISVCAWKPIIMTSSRDQTIRIWNYETNKIELVRKFQVDVNVVELNSTGLLAAIGFSDQLRITQIYLEELNIVKTYNFPRCKSVRYSAYGHLMAAAYDNTIAITSVYNLEVLMVLKGHNGTVLTVAWAQNDKFLLSGGAEGAIYQWDVETGARVQEIVQKGTEYRSLCVTNSDPFTIYAATNLGFIREFQNSTLMREIVIPSKQKSPLTCISLSRSDLIMFASNEQGNLVSVQLPFLGAGGGTCTNFRFFVSKINRLCFSYDGTLLVAVSKQGTLTIWTLENIEGKVAPLDTDLLKSQEVLIPRRILREKNDQIMNLEIRLRQQAEEFQYQLSQNEIFDGQQLAEVHRGYCQALEELKTRNNEIEQRHAEEMNTITFQINDLKEDHKKHLEKLSNQYSERMLIEYQKFNNLRESMLELRGSYEAKLKKSAGTLQDTVEGLECDYKKQLDQRKELIRELMKEMQDKKVEFLGYCRQVEADNDRNMVETQIQYENKLTDERNETQIWRGKTGVLQKKFETLTKETEGLLEEVELLKTEHIKSQKTISKLSRGIDDFQKDIADRDYAINSKENRIHELLHKNLELDKYKQVLTHKIAELKAQIEPREFQINDKRKHIREMENELAGLNQNNNQLELQLKELKDKYVSAVADLKLERHRAKAARECITNLCSEIYYVAGKMNSPEELRDAVKDLFEKHASDDELKRFISLDAQVRDEFQRQRAQIERVLRVCRNRSGDLNLKQKYNKLITENVFLLQEIDTLRTENINFRAKIKRNLSESKRSIGLKKNVDKTKKPAVMRK